MKVRPLVGKGKLASYATPPLSPVVDNFSSFRLGQEASHIGTQGMEGDDSYRRQYEHPNYHQTFPPNMQSRSIAGPSGTDIDDLQNIQDAPRSGPTQRFRQAQMLGQQTPTSMAIPAGGGHAQVSSGYGFGQAQYYTTTQHVQGNALQYQPDYGQDPQRPQQFTGYTSQMMQSVPQQIQAQSSYDNLPQFQPRQSAALGLSDQFPATQYYNTSQSTSASVPASMPQQYASVNYQPQSPYQPNPFMNRPAIPQHILPPAPVMAEAPQADSPEPEEQPTQTWEREFDDRIRVVNHHISDNRLSEAAPLLLELSQWLLGRVSEFGLHVDVVADDTVVHNQKLGVWDEFNLCWLALLQGQKENTEQEINDNVNPATLDHLISPRFLERMGSELVRLCDNIERHGLVDYEIGVAEEEIISVLTQCLDLLPSDEATTNSNAAAGSAAQS